MLAQLDALKYPHSEVTVEVVRATKGAYDAVRQPQSVLRRNDAGPVLIGIRPRLVHISYGRVEM